MGSGIHYHVDCGGAGPLYESLKNKLYRSPNHIEVKEREQILQELDTWNYKGSFNSRNIGEGYHYIRFNLGHNTMEFRIGEMTFDYNILVKRIYHANDIVRRVKESITYYTLPSYIPLSNTDYTIIQDFIKWQTAYKVQELIKVIGNVNGESYVSKNIVQNRVKQI